jgi:hypothetical protein
MPPHPEAGHTRIRDMNPATENRCGDRAEFGVACACHMILTFDINRIPRYQWRDAPFPPDFPYVVKGGSMRQLGGGQG